MHSGVARKRGSSHLASMQIAIEMKPRLPQASRADTGSSSTIAPPRGEAISSRDDMPAPNRDERSSIEPGLTASAARSTGRRPFDGRRSPGRLVDRARAPTAALPRSSDGSVGSLEVDDDRGVESPAGVRDVALPSSEAAIPAATVPLVVFGDGARAGGIAGCGAPDHAGAVALASTGTGDVASATAGAGVVGAPIGNVTAPGAAAMAGAG